MKSAAIGPWSKGIVNTVSPTAIPADALAEADNVDIDKVGHITARTTWLLADATPAHNLFEFNGTTYGVSEGIVGRLTTGSFEGYGYVVGEISWTILNGVPTFADHVGVYQVTGHTITRLDPGTLGAEEDELVLTPLPGGQWLEYWQGRLLLARGTTLIFSEPLRYGVYDPLRGYIRFEQQISWVAPLETGIYVGLRDSVRFLEGNDYRNLQQKVVGGPSWPGAAKVLVAPNMSNEMIKNADKVAVWMTDVGFAVGLPTGDVVFPQQDRLEGLPVTPGNLVVLGDRITVLPT